MQYCVEKPRIYVGEKRCMVFYVHSKKDENFIIRNASVEIIKNGNVIDTPGCTIDTHEISFMVDSTDYRKGFYDIILTYDVADETLKAKFNLEVM